MRVYLNNITRRTLTKTCGASPTSIRHAQFMRTREFKSEIILGRSALFSNDEWLQSLLRKNTSRHFVITDKTVGALYKDQLDHFMRSHGLDIDILTIPVGEKSKSIDVYKKISSQILGKGMDRNSYIIGFGGGVVNNIAGFLASTLYRGIGLIQIPTSLLAQVDAAIDFKQAINGPLGKNHFGSFYPADIIVIDPDILQTLPDRHLRNGLAESIKHALTQDCALYTYLRSYTWPIRDPAFLDKVITQTINLKIMLLNNPPNQECSETLLQYGHAIGHALEQSSHYAILHGEAITIGMCVTTEIARLLDICDDETVRNHYEIMAHFGLPTTIPQHIRTSKLLSILRHDKYFAQGCMKTSLVSKVGSIAHSNNNGCTFSIENGVIRSAIARNRHASASKHIDKGEL